MTNEYYEAIKKRYLALSDAEKELIRKLIKTKTGVALTKIFGKEFMDRFTLLEPKKRGLASR
tara:strand:- start:81 stop:266 length:186 start_codon:yes stop_codon:yes gene_type:complete